MGRLANLGLARVPAVSGFRRYTVLVRSAVHSIRVDSPATRPMNGVFPERHETTRAGTPSFATSEIWVAVGDSAPIMDLG